MSAENEPMAALLVRQFCALLNDQNTKLLKDHLPPSISYIQMQNLNAIVRLCRGQTRSSPARKRRRGETGNAEGEPNNDIEGGGDGEGDGSANANSNEHNRAEPGVGGSGPKRARQDHTYRPWKMILDLDCLDVAGGVLKLFKSPCEPAQFFRLKDDSKANPQQHKRDWVQSIASMCHYMVALESRRDADHVRWLFVVMSIADAERLVGHIQVTPNGTDSEDCWWLSSHETAKASLASIKKSMSNRLRSASATDASAVDSRAVEMQDLAIEAELREWTTIGRKLITLCQQEGVGFGAILLMSKQLSRAFLSKRFTVRESSAHFVAGLQKIRELLAAAPTGQVEEANKIANSFRAFLAEPFEEARKQQNAHR